MGLFSRHQPQSSHPQRPQDKLYIFIRASDASQTANATWSIAVAESSSRQPQTRTPSPEGHQTRPADRPKKPFFSLHSRRSSISSDQDTLATEDSDTTALETLTEFSLNSGTLRTTHPDQTTDSSSTKSQPLLLKILLPTPQQPPSPSRSKPSPSPSLEDLLSQTTSTHWNQSLPWVQTALSTLQSTNHLPSPPTFSVSRLLDYATNHLTQLRRRPSHSRTNKVVELDYTSHLAENARLRALFGHDGNSASGTNPVGEDRGGRTMGRWWVSQPQGRGDWQNPYPRASSQRDVYGGLM